MYMKNNKTLTVVTAGSNYIDIDAYACCVAMKELLSLQGYRAVCYSAAVPNYSICQSLTEEGQMLSALPSEHLKDKVQYVIVDVSDPDYIKDAAPIDLVCAVYDHHVGFEEYWSERIGEDSHIEFIGAAATLIYREWKKADLQDQMTRSTALLLIAAILDNTLNLTSSNTTEEDRESFRALCKKTGVDDAFRGVYFSEVQAKVEKDLQNALLNDVKRIGQSPVLPANVAQLCVWDADGMLARLPQIRIWLEGLEGGWMLNLIDIKHHRSYFVCDDIHRQKEIERLFGVGFKDGVALSAQPYLRKQILKAVLNDKEGGNNL